MRNWPVLLLLCLPTAAAEKAAYDSNGRIIAMLSDAEDVEVASSIVAVLSSGKRIPLQVRRAGIGATRQGSAFAWSMAVELPDGGKGRIELKSEEDAAGVRYTSAISAQTAMEVDAIEFVLDAPRTLFLNGRATPEGAQPIPLASVRAAGPVLYRGDVTALHLRDATGSLALDIGFDKPASTSLVDRWDTSGRSFQIRAVIMRGPLASGATAALTTSLRLANTPPPPAPARLVLDNSKPWYHFDGFGGNYCWNTRSSISAYTLSNLKLAWARVEMKVQAFDRQRDNPPGDVRGDLEAMAVSSKWVCST